MTTQRAQSIILWSSIIAVSLWGFGYIWLMGLFPLPDATLGAQEVASFYAANALKIKIGAMICSWTGAWQVPFAVVLFVQMTRLEKGVPVWSILQLATGAMSSLFLVLPPLFWGVAAFSADRAPELTLLMHELANLTFVTTPQFGLFQFSAIAIVILTQRTDVDSAFPRWSGYLTIWTMFAFELGAFGFLTKVGPFSWNGLFVLWVPVCVFSVWFGTMSLLLLRALKRQSTAVDA